MSDGKFYKIVILLLLLLNGGTLTYLLLNNSRPAETQGRGMPPQDNRPDRIMSEKLSLTQEQNDLLRELKDEHHSQIVEIQQEERKLHQELFVLLKATTIDTVAKSALLERLEGNDRMKEEVTFEHFRKIRGILTAEQLPKFEELVAEIAGQIMSHHPMHKGPPPGRR